MVAVAKQVAIGGLDSDLDETKESEAAGVWREQLWSAMRLFVESYVDTNGLAKYDGCAYRMNKIWEPKGRPVTAGALKNALLDSNRNNFRLEWADWFAARSPEVADLLARRVKPTQTDGEYARALEAEIRETLSHREAEKLFRRARAR